MFQESQRTFEDEINELLGLLLLLLFFFFVVKVYVTGFIIYKNINFFMGHITLVHETLCFNIFSRHVHTCLRTKLSAMDLSEHQQTMLLILDFFEQSSTQILCTKLPNVTKYKDTCFPRVLFEHYYGISIIFIYFF
jgi:hypothetical protein